MESVVAAIMILKLILTVLSVSSTLTLGMTYSDFTGDDALNTQPKRGLFAAGGFESYSEEMPWFGFRGEFAYNRRGARQNEGFLRSLSTYDPIGRTFQGRTTYGSTTVYHDVGQLNIDALQIGLFEKFRALPEKGFLAPFFSPGIAWMGGPRNGGVVVKHNNATYVATSPEGYTVFQWSDMNYSWWDLVLSAGLDFVTHEDRTVDSKTQHIVKRWAGLEFRYLVGLNSISDPNTFLGEKNIRNSGFSLSLMIY
jgi:hypothetical protein